MMQAAVWHRVHHVGLCVRSRYMFVRLRAYLIHVTRVTSLRVSVAFLYDVPSFCNVGPFALGRCNRRALL